MDMWSVQPTQPAAQSPAALKAALDSIADLIAHGRPEEANARLAPLLHAHPTDRAIRRMQARATIDPATAIQRWHALRLEAPEDPQTHLDLAQALRDRLDDHPMADAVLIAARHRFPDHLGLLQAQLQAAIQTGDDEAIAVACQRLLHAHPDHAPTQTTLIDAQERLGHTEDAIALLLQQADANPDDPGPLLRLAALSETQPLQALEHYAALRAHHPQLPATHLGLARMLNALDRGDEADEILTQAHARLPDDPAIAIAWAEQALDSGDLEAAADRAARLRQAAPDIPEAVQIEAEALLQAERPEPALVLLERACQDFANNFPLAELRVQALTRLGRWHEAARTGQALFRRFPQEPTACIDLATALVRLGRSREAEALLREAREHAPGHPWMSAQIARLAADRGAIEESLAWWRDAGLPLQGPDAWRRHYAIALAATGHQADALTVARTTPSSTEPPWLRLAEAEILAAGDTPAQAIPLWHDLQAHFPLADPAFAALAWRLATTQDPDQTRPILQAMLAEPDSPEPAWRPAIARHLAATEPSDPIHARIAALLAAEPGPDTMARAIAESLCGPTGDIDSLARTVARAVHDGRPALIAALLENASRPERTERLRIALRLTVNRLAPSDVAFGLLPPTQVAALLLAARVFDEDSLAYLIDLARPHFPAAQPPNLPKIEDVIGCIVHRRLPDERPTPGTPLPGRLRIAVCLHGHPPEAAAQRDPRPALALEDHDVTVFAHLWAGPSLRPQGPAETLATLPPGLQSALQPLVAAHGITAVATLYPDLFEPAEAPPTLTVHDARTRYATPHIILEDPALPHLADRSQAWLRRYKVQQAHEMALRTATSFDLVIHLDACAVPALRQRTDWHAIAVDARQGFLFADTGLAFRRDAVLLLGDGMVAGAMPEMQLAADSFAVGSFIEAGQGRIAGFTGPDIHRHSQPVMLHLLGVTIIDMPEWLQPRSPGPRVPRIQPGEALSRLWACIKRRDAAGPDSLLLRAAMADVTGGVPI